MIAADITAIVLAWAALYALFAGVGMLAVVAAGMRPASWVGGLFWVGWATTIAVLQLVHLFRPIDGTILAVFAAAGIAGLAYGARAVGVGRFRAGMFPAVAVIACVAICAARHSLVPARNYDSGTYHVPIVLWLNTYRIVPGLGNLHIRLAFNNSVSLYEALLNVGVLRGATLNLSLGLLFVAVVGELVWCALDAMAWRSRAPLAAASALAVPFLIAPLNSSAFEGLSPDLAIYCCELAIGFMILRLAIARAQRTAAGLDAFALAVLGAVTITVKPSAGPFVVAAAMWMAVTWRPWLPRRATAFAALFSVAVVGTWMLRSVMLAGYPLFPLLVAPLPVSWRIPMETMRQNYGWIRAMPRANDNSMRVPFEVILSNWQWLRPWFWRVIPNLWGIILPLAWVAGFLTLVAVTGRLRDRAIRPVLSALLVPSVALVAWFFLAPDPRFAEPLFLVLAVLACGAAFVAAETSPRSLARLRVAVCLVVVALTAKQAQNVYKTWRMWPAATAFHELPVVATGPLRESGGLIVNVPLVAETCWAAALPCTPYPSSEVRLIRDRDLGSGFRVFPFHENALVGWWSRDRPWTAMKPGVTGPAQKLE